MKHFGLIGLFLLCSGLLNLQAQSNMREKMLSSEKDTIYLDSLSIQPSSLVVLKPDKTNIPDTLYSFSWVDATLIIGPGLRSVTDSLYISYRVFPVRFNQKYRYLEPGQNRIDPVKKNSLLTGRPDTESGFQSGSSIYTSGNLSRGILLGNNQDASLNSNLNLQISGKINSKFSIEAQLSDANIPIQPEGNTRQLKEFDRINISIYSATTRITAGDFTLDSPEGYFQQMNKNLQGLQFKTAIGGKDDDRKNFQTRTTAAVVKGKFNRMKIQGAEGNQGPYRLTGQDGELYIQVIAGSEKVFIDGLPLERGENEDYVINYNTAELSFTPKNLITRDKRITVQFEYTERSYTRFVAASENQWKTDKLLLYLNLYSEADARNQPLLQDLTDSQKNFLSTIGDQLDQARVSNYYETEFQNKRVLYQLKDSLVDGITYNNILVYSVNPDSARYQAGFSMVGQNMGNYIAIQSAANGQVYQWIAPVNGIPQGNYEPVTKLITPKSKQIYSLGAVSAIGNKMTFTAELSLSSNDINTFSSLDRSDNQGTGLVSRIDRLDKFGNDSSLILKSYLSYRRVGKNYDALEPFRSVEFERDWNLENQVPAVVENYWQTGVLLMGRDSLQAAYSFDWLKYQQEYSGLKHNSYGQFYMQDFKIQWSGSYLQSEDSFRNTDFLRHEVQLSKELKWFQFKLKERQEGNKWSANQSDSLEPGSFRFQEWMAEITQPDQADNPWFLRMLMRTDYAPDNTRFLSDYQSMEVSSGLSIKGKAAQSTSFSGTFRKLQNLGNFGIQLPEENSATIRAEEQFQLKKGAVVSRSFYEVGSGLERKQDFYYLEVPQGQGYYTWADYNGNSIKELDEFEPAVFADQANYIRVFRPGNDYVPVYTNRFTQTLSLYPGRFIQSKESGGQFLNLFSNQFAFSTHRRNTRSDFLSALNPRNIEDSLVVSLQSQLRNSLSFNTAQRKLGLDYILLKTNNQNLMTYGTDYRELNSHSLVMRIRLVDLLWINNQLEKGKSAYASSFFTQRNYSLDYWRNNLTLTLEANDNIRMKTGWNLAVENNQDGLEKVRQHQVEIGGDYQTPTKGVIHLDLQYIHLQFEGEPDSPVGYVMLKGFRPGHNGMANLSIRRKINKVIQLDINYGARISQDSQVIHTGNIAVRAVF